MDAPAQRLRKQSTIMPRDSNNTALTDDFGNPEIVARPRGKIYTTARNAKVTDAHRRLLAARDLCRVRQG